MAFEENILLTKDGYELPSLWPIQELMECWLLLDKMPWRLHVGDAGREISSLVASALYLLERLLGLGKTC